MDNVSFEVIVNLLKSSIDSNAKATENLTNKLEEFLDKQSVTNEQVAQHSRDIAELKESKEAKWAQRHPVFAGGLNYIILIVIFVVIAHFAPNVAHLVGSI